MEKQTNHDEEIKQLMKAIEEDRKNPAPPSFKIVWEHGIVTVKRSTKIGARPKYSFGESAEYPTLLALMAIIGWDGWELVGQVEGEIYVKRVKI